MVPVMSLHLDTYQQTPNIKHIFKDSPTRGLGVEEVAGVGAPCVHLARLPGHDPISQRLLHRLLHLDRAELKRCMAECGWVVLATSERKG